MPETELQEYRLKLLEEAVKDIGGSLKAIQQTLATLTTLEARHTETREALDRAFKAVERNAARLDSLEQKLPVLQLTSSWVRGGVLAAVGLLLAAVLKLILPT